MKNEGKGLQDSGAAEWAEGDGSFGAGMAMRERIRDMDWAGTALGPAPAWSQPLKSFVGLMLNSAQPMFLAWGPERVWLYNDAFIPILGRKHPDALGRPSREVWAEAWPDLAPRFDRVFEGVPVQMDDLALALNRHRPPEEAHFAFSCSPAPDDEGRVAGVFGACLETTAQFAATPAFREADERLKLALIAGGGVGAWDWDIPADRVFADAGFAALYRVDPVKARMGAPVADFFTAVHPDDTKRVQDDLAKALAHCAEFNSEYRLVQSDGTARWVIARGRCIPDAKGRPVRLPGATFDITARKVAELRREALATLTNRIEELHDPDELAYAGAKLLGQTLEVSRAGYGRVDVAAETITIERDWNAPGVTTIAGTLRFRDYGSYIEDLARGETVVFEDAYRDPRTESHAGSLEAISAQSAVNMPVTEHGGFVALLYLNHATARAWPPEDLALIREFAARIRTATERLRVSAALRDSEAQLRAANETLEMRVQQRTSELMRAEEALLHSQKMEAVGQLTGGLAHDFNNLLAGITGSLELLEKRLGEGRFSNLDRYIATAQASARRAAALTQRLLAFARRQTLNPRSVDANKMIAGLTELLNRSIGPDVKLDFVHAVGLWTTKLDPGQLENALLNLCINARDAMAPHGGAITIETANAWLDARAAKDRDLPPGQYISLCVTDTGSGMAPDVIAKAFDPFFTTKPLGQGTGLGLSMVYGFVRQSGGQVRIYSEIGKGTTVCLYLPRFVGPAETEEAPEVADVDPGFGETVLVIDDEASIRALVSEVLGDHGYRVLEAEDGPSGLKILQSKVRIDLLITDVGLPGGLNGRQVADAARVSRPALKVLFITGFAENAAIGNGHIDPGMSIITKPFAITAIANKVRELLDA